jgi:hypothetical protein
MNQTFSLGTVSSGTMRPEDLIPAFASALESFAPEHELVKEATDYQPDRSSGTVDYEGPFVEALMDALDELAPPLTYFGTHEGDGADYGFWPRWDAIAEARETAKIRYWAQQEYEYLEELEVFIRDMDLHIAVYSPGITPRLKLQFPDKLLWTTLRWPNQPDCYALAESTSRSDTMPTPDRCPHYTPSQGCPLHGETCR